MSEHGHEHLTGEKPASHTNQMILMIVFFAVWVIDSFLLRVTTFLFDLNLIWIYIISGIVILAISVYSMDRSHKDLFDTRVEGIASVGVYGRVRHPMYLGTFLFYLGLAVATFSLAAIGVWIVAVVYYNSLANYEENLLEERFGTEYLEYKKNVRKWI
ncbi:MAG: isoprenylcysteine carboxylmethyltransferase family protein, partial [Candidatus Thorarchaeota archaeon]